MLCAASSGSEGSGVAAHQSREVLDGLMAGPRPGLPAPTSGNQPPIIVTIIVIVIIIIVIVIVIVIVITVTIITIIIITIVIIMLSSS